VPFPMRLPARWLASAMARLTFLSGVGYVGAAYTVSRFLTRPRRRKLTTSPASLGMTYRDVDVETEDGIRLSGWLVEPENARGTVALFHGMRHNRERLLDRIAFLYNAGYRCLALDHRAHGESAGKRISWGWYEERDVRAPPPAGSKKTFRVSRAMHMACRWAAQPFALPARIVAGSGLFSKGFMPTWIPPSAVALAFIIPPGLASYTRPSSGLPRNACACG
jgi:hypothetical protein